jgi:hypothetical protein
VLFGTSKTTLPVPLGLNSRFAFVWVGDSSDPTITVAPRFDDPPTPADTLLPMLSPYYSVDVSMPITTALTLVRLDLTIRYLLVLSITIPVRSRTPFANKSVSYSRYSLAEGDVLELTAILTVAVVAPLLQTDTVTTENVSAGTVYTVVSVVADKSATPNLPVAI